MIIESKGVEISKLKEINYNLKENNSLKIVLVVDANKTVQSSGVANNLNVLQYIYNVQNLSIHCNSNILLNDISELSHINNLSNLELVGFINKNINIEPILRFYQMKSLKLDFKISTSKYEKIINSFINLQKLSVYDLDLCNMPKLDMLLDLEINNSLKNEFLIHKKCPNLKKIKLVKCNTIEHFDFLNSLIFLEEISLCNMRQFKQFPALNQLNNITKINLISNKNLYDIENILFFKQLRSLRITEVRDIPVNDLVKFERLEYLKIVYILYFNKSSAKQFEALSLKNNWIV